MFTVEFTIWTLVTLVAAVAAAQLAGFLWYSLGVGFGKKWVAEVGLTEKKMNSPEFKKKQGKAMVFDPVLSLVLAYGLMVMLDNMIVFSLLEAVKVTGFMWLVLVVPTVGLNYLYNPNLNFNLFKIDIFHHLLSMLVMAIVITWM